MPQSLTRVVDILSYLLHSGSWVCLDFWWVWRQLAAHPTSKPHPKTPNHMAQQRNPPGAHLESTVHCMAHGPYREPSPPQTPSKKEQEPTSHPLGFIILFLRGKRDAVGNIEALSSLSTAKGTGNSRKTFQTENQTQVGDRAGSLVDLLEL